MLLRAYRPLFATLLLFVVALTPISAGSAEPAEVARQVGAQDASCET